jgi:cytochrome c
VHRRQAVRAAAAKFIGVAVLVLGGCAPESPPVLAPPSAPVQPGAGARLFIEKGCGGCHTLAGIVGATGTTGPSLTNVVLRPTLAGESIVNSPENLVQWLLDPPSLKPGTGMPRLGLTDAEARDIVGFLETLPRAP